MARTGASRVSSRVERPASPGATQVERRLRDVAARARKRNRGRAARRHDRRGDRAHVWVYGADAPRRAPYALAQRALAGGCLSYPRMACGVCAECARQDQRSPVPIPRRSSVVRHSLPPHDAQPDQEQNPADQDWPPRPRRARNRKKQRRDAKDNDRTDRHQPVPSHAILNSSRGHSILARVCAYPTEP